MPNAGPFGAHSATVFAGVFRAVLHIRRVAAGQALTIALWIKALK
jgi:hypothetical protein